MMVPRSFAHPARYSGGYLATASSIAAVTLVSSVACHGACCRANLVRADIKVC